MTWWARWLLRRPSWVLLGLGVMTGVALLGVSRLTLDPSNTGLLPQHSAAAQTYRHFLATFGSDEAVLVALHDPHQELLTPEGLSALRQLTQALEATPHVAAVYSVTNAVDIAKLSLTPFGLAMPRLLPDDTVSREQRQALRHHEQVQGFLLSQDLQTAGLLVVPDAAVTAPAVRTTWLHAVRTVAAQHGQQGRQTYVAGTPLERHDVTVYLQRDQQRIIPLVLLILLVVTYRIYRIKRFALLALVCVLLSLSWTLGVVGFLGIPLNVITALLPAIMLVVSVSVVIHLLNQYLDEVAAGASGKTAVENAMAHVGTACFLTSLTTALGFFSLPVHEAPAVQEFGLFASLGVLLAFVTTMTFLPVALLWVGRIDPTRARPLQSGWLEQTLDQLPLWVVRHRRAVFVGSILSLGVMLPGLWQIHEGTDIIRALHTEAPLRVSTEFIDQHLTGVHSLEVLVSLPTDTAAVTPASIRQVLTFSQWLRTQPHVTTVLSPWEPLRLVPPARRDNDEQLSLLATLVPLGLPTTTWLNTEQRMLRLSALVSAIDSEQFLALAHHAVHHAAQLALPVQVTGSNYLLALMSRTLVRNQITSLGLAVLLILGSITLALRSWKLGVIAAIPNLLPTIMIFGVMGWCGIELSTATTMIASVALGLLVDDTIHLLYQYQREKRRGLPPLDAIRRALRHSGRAVIFTTIILTLGFWTGVLGSFKPTIHFSFLTGLTMLFALIIELLVTPAAILAWEGVE